MQPGGQYKCLIFINVLKLHVTLQVEDLPQKRNYGGLASR